MTRTTLLFILSLSVAGMSAELDAFTVTDLRCEDLLDPLSAKALLGGKRKFKGCAFEVADQNDQVVWIKGGVLGAALEEIVRVADDVLIGGTAGSDHHHRTEILTAPGPAGLLPGAGYGPRVPGHHAHIQPAYINAQFQSIG